MDERSIALLRRKLEALGYDERLDAPSAAPLVARLVDDLARTTDGYRAAKLQSAKYAQEIATFNGKVRTRGCKVCGGEGKSVGHGGKVGGGVHARGACAPAGWRVLFFVPPTHSSTLLLIRPPTCPT